MPLLSHFRWIIAHKFIRIALRVAPPDTERRKFARAIEQWVDPRAAKRARDQLEARLAKKILAAANTSEQDEAPKGKSRRP